MPEAQISLPLDVSASHAPAAGPELRDEIAQLWGLPLGQRVTLDLRGHQATTATGILELRSAPDYPWNPRQPLHLHIAGLDFSSRDIEHWSKT